jgi:transposase
MGRYVGIDLHKNMFVACFWEAEERQQLVRYPMGQIEQFVKALRADDVVGVESTGNTAYFVRKVEGNAASVKVIHPGKFKVIAESTSKTDAKDARTIAWYLAKGMVPEVRMKDGAQVELASLAQTRDRLVKLRTALMNKIHNLLSAQGILLRRESLGSQKGLEEALRTPVSEVSAIELKVLGKEIRSLNESIAELDRELAERGKTLPGHRNLSSIKGIGDKSATILLSVIGDIQDFASAKKLSAYFGMAPRVEVSNETRHYGRITKKGTKMGRTTLVQCTWVAIRYSPYLRKFYERIKAGKGSGKAIIATARKLLGIIYDTLKHDWVFKDFTRFELETDAA